MIEPNSTINIASFGSMTSPHSKIPAPLLVSAKATPPVKKKKTQKFLRAFDSASCVA
jgi:hypothetical protein